MSFKKAVKLKHGQQHQQLNRIAVQARVSQLGKLEEGDRNRIALEFTVSRIYINGIVGPLKSYHHDWHDPIKDATLNYGENTMTVGHKFSSDYFHPRHKFHGPC